MMVTTVAGRRPTLGPAVVALLVAVVVAAVVLGLFAGRAAHADTTFTVDRSDDPDLATTPTAGECTEAANDCSLRGAITKANTTAGADTITFDIPDDPTDPDDDVKTIRPESALPIITDAVTIDGYTQPGSQPNTLAVGNDAVLNIELDGEKTASADGLELDDSIGDASNSVVRGLVINSFDDGGIKAYANNSRIEGNFLGTDPSGTDEESNDWGVRVGGTDNTIGGASPEARNLISGNNDYGVFLEPQSAGNSVLGNYIGTKKEGTSRLGNEDAGVFILGSNDNRIGGTTAAEANRIAFNGSSGVAIDEFRGSLANGNRILNNSIFSHGDLGIDLETDGPTTNDRKDDDDGPNRLQNKPVLDSAETTGTRITIEGRLNSKPNRTFTIRFFSNPVFSPAGYEGKTFLGSTSVTTDENGDASFTRQLAKAVRPGQVLTATATGLGGNTSEFSGPRRVAQQ